MGRDERIGCSAALRRAVVVAAVVTVFAVVLAVLIDPGSGTGINLQPADDVAALVVGAHHAKPVPATGMALLSVLLLAVAVAVVHGASPVRPMAFLRRRRDDVRPLEGADAPGWRAWRAPPASFTA